MMPFFSRNWAGACGGLPGLRSWYFSAKTRKKGGRRGLCPWPLRCLSQILSERERRECLDCLVLAYGFFCVPFNRWGGHVFIVYVVPNLRVVRILSYWDGIFLAFIE